MHHRLPARCNKRRHGKEPARVLVPPMRRRDRDRFPSSWVGHRGGHARITFAKEENVHAEQSLGEGGEGGGRVLRQELEEGLELLLFGLCERVLLLEVAPATPSRSAPRIVSLAHTRNADTSTGKKHIERTHTPKLQHTKPPPLQ
eukprot:3938831-Rhodomonas_salina.1